MNLASQTRADAIDTVSTTLMHRSSRLLRLLTSFGTRELSRTEIGLLVTLLDGPRRITELADTEALAQPTVTKLVDGLQERHLVDRGRSPADGRVVLVAISEDGRAKVAEMRAVFHNLMRDTVEHLSNEQLSVLVEATSIMGDMIKSLQNRRLLG